MPELPEVETFVRKLRDGDDAIPAVIGLTAAAAEVFWAKTLAAPPEEEFVRRISGQTVRSLTRRGKFLVFGLDHDWLLIHLRMSGDLLMFPPGGVDLPKHIRLAITFTNGWQLAFNDPRKFGRAWLTADPAEVTGGLGVEPLDESLTAAEFHRLLRAKNRQLKPLLLDQKFIAGVGNIYSDEALHLAGLHPLRKAGGVSEAEAGRLLSALRQVLTEGIKRNGASIDWVYRGGAFQNHFRVYGRTGEPCPVCGTPITHLLVGQRSTHICTKCQALED
jgi:formamidopyrimidine-DNA glycosylase